jgi:hypothetical protein
MRRITALTNSGLAFLVIFASVPIAWAGESNAGPATGPAQLWSTCFVRGALPDGICQCRAAAAVDR